MKPCPVCKQAVEVEVRRVSKRGLGIWEIGCCKTVTSPSLDVVFKKWDDLSEDENAKDKTI